MANEESIIYLLQSGASSGWTTFFIIMSYLGSFAGALLTIGFIFGYRMYSTQKKCKLMFGKDIKSFSAIRFTSEKQIKSFLDIFLFGKFYPYIFAGTYILSVGLNYVIKELVGRARPYEAFKDITCIYGDFGSSMPSGHAVSVMVIAIFTCYMVFRLSDKKWFKALICCLMGALIASVVTARLYLGIHYPTDIIMGLLIGIVMSIIGILIFKKLSKTVQIKKID